MEHENANSTYSVKIGKTTYTVCVKQSKTATKPLETAFRDICRHEVLGDLSTADTLNLDRISKLS